MIEELLYEMLDNMKDCIIKMKDSNIDLETIKLNVINEWDYFIPYGSVHDIGLRIINEAPSVVDLAYQIDCLFDFVMNNADSKDVKLSVNEYRKRQLKKDFRKGKIK